MEQIDSLGKLDMRSTEPELLSDGVDSNNNDDYTSNATDLNDSDDPQPSSDTHERQPFRKWDLRPGRESKRIAPNTWVDADSTGDFDPLEEGRWARSRRKRTKLPHRKKNDWNSEDNINDPTVVAEEPTPVLSLSFSSSLGRTAFSELCSKLEQEAQSTFDHFTTGYQLRKRDSVGGSGGFEAMIVTTGLRVIASEPLCDYSNHPVGRGCVGCLSLGQKCSLLDNEHAWPCDECDADKNDCQMVQDPVLKKSCTGCVYLRERKKWVVCSFSYSNDPSDHHGRCERCKELDQECIAGPRPGITRTRIRIGPDGAPYMNKAQVDQKTSHVSTCKQCLNSERVCSFASRSSHGTGTAACTSCEMSGEPCEPLGQKKHGSRAPQQRSVKASTSAASGLDLGVSIITTFSSPSRPPDLDEVHRSEHTPNTSADLLGQISGDTSDIGGTVKTVRTKFCHPMNFDYQDESLDGSDPCHFCSCEHFSIIGLEEREANVIDWYDGRGWEEIGGGHRGENVKGTQVCTRCTMSRIHIMVCDDHALRRITEAGTGSDLQAAFERLLDPEQAAGDRFCSICVNLAVWECCVAQEGEMGEGCGLTLCKPCVADLRRCGGSLDTMLQALVDELSEARPAGLRADYDLLKNDGLLARYLNWSATL